MYHAVARNKALKWTQSIIYTKYVSQVRWRTTSWSLLEHYLSNIKVYVSFLISCSHAFWNLDHPWKYTSLWWFVLSWLTTTPFLLYGDHDLSRRSSNLNLPLVISRNIKYWILNVELDLKLLAQRPPRHLMFQLFYSGKRHTI